MVLLGEPPLHRQDEDEEPGGAGHAERGRAPAPGRRRDRHEHGQAPHPVVRPGDGGDEQTEHHDHADLEGQDQAVVLPGTSGRSAGSPQPVQPAAQEPGRRHGEQGAHHPGEVPGGLRQPPGDRALEVLIARVVGETGAPRIPHGRGEELPGLGGGSQGGQERQSDGAARHGGCRPPLPACQEHQDRDCRCQLDRGGQAAEGPAPARALRNQEQVHGHQRHENGVDLRILHGLGEGLQGDDPDERQPRRQAARHPGRDSQPPENRVGGHGCAQRRGHDQQHGGLLVRHPGQGRDHPGRQRRVGEGPQVLTRVGVPAVEVSAVEPLTDGLVVDEGIQLEQPLAVLIHQGPVGGHQQGQPSQSGDDER